MRYKAFKFDNSMDLNPFDDGKVTIPTGVLKGTTEGIHGPEVQFLGRSLPVTTAILPAAVRRSWYHYGVKRGTSYSFRIQLGGALTAAGMTEATF